MSSPRSRNRTQGAFGNRRPRPLGYIPESPRELPVVSEGKQRTMAENLVSFCSGLLENAQMEINKARANNLPNSELRQLQHTLTKGAMNIGISVWNASIMGDKAIMNARKVIGALPQAEGIDELIDELLDKKARLFPDEKNLITNFLMPFSERNGGSFTISAVNVNPEGVQKADLSDLVKVGG